MLLQCRYIWSHWRQIYGKLRVSYAITDLCDFAKTGFTTWHVRWYVTMNHVYIIVINIIINKQFNVKTYIVNRNLSKSFSFHATAVERESVDRVFVTRPECIHVAIVLYCICTYDCRRHHASVRLPVTCC